MQSNHLLFGERGFRKIELEEMPSLVKPEIPVDRLAELAMAIGNQPPYPAQLSRNQLLASVKYVGVSLRQEPVSIHAYDEFRSSYKGEVFLPSSSVIRKYIRGNWYQIWMQAEERFGV